MTQTTEEILFPVMDGPGIPWRMIAPYNTVAKKRHSQDLQMLARRGGLSAAEVVTLMRGVDIYSFSREKLNDTPNWIEQLDSMIQTWKANDQRELINDLTTKLEQAMKMQPPPVYNIDTTGWRQDEAVQLLNRRVEDLQARCEYLEQPFASSKLNWHWELYRTNPNLFENWINALAQCGAIIAVAYGFIKLIGEHDNCDDNHCIHKAVNLDQKCSACELRHSFEQALEMNRNGKPEQR